MSDNRRASCPIVEDDVGYSAAGALAIPWAAEAAPGAIDLVAVARLYAPAMAVVVAAGEVYALNRAGMMIWEGVAQAIRGHIDGDGGFVLDDDIGSEWGIHGTLHHSWEADLAESRDFWQRLVDAGLVVGHQTADTEESALARRDDVQALQDFLNNHPTDRSQDQGERTGIAAWLGSILKASGLEQDIYGNIVDPNVVDTNTGERWDGGAIKGPLDRGITAEKINEFGREIGPGNPFRGPWKPPTTPRGSAGSAMLLVLADKERARQRLLDATAKYRDLSRTRNLLGVDPDGTVYDPNDPGTTPSDGLNVPDAQNPDNPDQDADGRGEDTEDAQNQIDEVLGGDGLKLGQDYLDNLTFGFKLTGHNPVGPAGPRGDPGLEGASGGGGGHGPDPSIHGGTVGGLGTGSGTGSDGDPGTSGGGSDYDDGVGDSPSGTGPEDGPNPDSDVMTEADWEALNNQPSDAFSGNVYGGRSHVLGDEGFTSGGVSTGWRGEADCDDGCVCHCPYVPNYGRCPAHGGDEWPGVTREYADDGSGSYQDFCCNCGCPRGSGRYMGG